MPLPVFIATGIAGSTIRTAGRHDPHRIRRRRGQGWRRRERSRARSASVKPLADSHAARPP
jgi:hypothetical protein